MKKVLVIVAICALVGCTSKASKSEDCAQGFLKAFLANDFSGAVAFCSDEFKVEFGRAMEDFTKLDESVKFLLEEQCSKLEANIKGVERLNESDTFIVRYNIVKNIPDSSTVAQSKELFASELKVVEGKVVALNR